MIASLSLTIVLICNVPMYIHAEMGGQSHTYEIQRYIRTPEGKLAYWVGRQKHKEFLADVQHETEIRHMLPDYQNYGDGCHSL